MEQRLSWRIGLWLAAVLSSVALLPACKTRLTPEMLATEPPTQVAEQLTSTPVGATSTPVAPTTEPPPTDVPTEEPSPVPVLPPQPLEMAFESTDGTRLSGTYYPGATNPSPVVVLMHWAPGDRRDWDVIARWLQNRGEVGQGAESEERPWLDGSWFPELNDSLSYAVFTFDFRGCSGGCEGFERQGWLKDARSAVAFARSLPGVDAGRLVAVGASIGADGAADACLEGCLGAFSLSPGSYLTVPYADAVDALGDEPVRPAHCLAAGDDTEAVQACASASGSHYTSTIYAQGGHGMELVDPDVQPGVLDLLLRFLDSTLGD